MAVHVTRCTVLHVIFYDVTYDIPIWYTKLYLLYLLHLIVSSDSEPPKVYYYSCGKQFTIRERSVCTRRDVIISAHIDSSRHAIDMGVYHYIASPRSQ